MRAQGHRRLVLFGGGGAVEIAFAIRVRAEAAGVSLPLTLIEAKPDLLPEFDGGRRLRCPTGFSFGAQGGCVRGSRGPVLAENLGAAMTGNTHRGAVTYQPQSSYLSILDTADGCAIMRWKGYVFRSRAALWLMSYIDSRFVDRYRQGS